MPAFDKIVVVTQKTALEELLERYTTRDQAKFYLEHMGVPFEPYQAAHDAYRDALEHLKQNLPTGVRHQFIDRSFLPTVLFGPQNLIVTLGRDGLVVNAAKYLSGQPLVGLNPDPARIDGVLLPFAVRQAAFVLPKVLAEKFDEAHVTMAKAALNTGQSLYAVNDFFVGQRTHTSARYRLRHGKREEDQSSSGVIVSTGAGSTGWFRSVLAMSAGVADGMGAGSKLTNRLREQYQFPWDADFLRFAVREPFTSKTSAAGLVCGKVPAGGELVITSQMPRNGIIFSDGVEADAIEFNSGTVLRIGVADKRLRLVTKVG